MAVAVQARLTAGVRVTPLCHADVHAVAARWPAAADREAHVGHEVVHVAVCDADGSGVRVGIERRVCAGVIRRQAPVCSVATCNVCRVRLIIL